MAFEELAFFNLAMCDQRENENAGKLANLCQSVSPVEDILTLCEPDFILVASTDGAGLFPEEWKRDADRFVAWQQRNRLRTNGERVSSWQPKIERSIAAALRAHS